MTHPAFKENGEGADGQSCQMGKVEAEEPSRAKGSASPGCRPPSRGGQGFSAAGCLPTRREDGGVRTAIEAHNDLKAVHQSVLEY